MIIPHEFLTVFGFFLWFIALFFFGFMTFWFIRNKEDNFDVAVSIAAALVFLLLLGLGLAILGFVTIE